jgi:uncharacterized protein YbjT (DUF2867 family)
MIVVTSATGQIGSQVLENLLDTDENLRVIARDPASLCSAERDPREAHATARERGGTF